MCFVLVFISVFKHIIISSTTVHHNVSHYSFEKVIISKQLWICCGYVAYFKRTLNHNLTLLQENISTMNPIYKVLCSWRTELKSRIIVFPFHCLFHYLNDVIFPALPQDRFEGFVDTHPRSALQMYILQGLLKHRYDQLTLVLPRSP